MKKMFFFLVAVFTCINSFSQDILILKTGDEIKSKVLEVSTDQIKYKKWENIDGPTYLSLKSEIFMIKYSNGTKDVFNTVINSNSIQSNVVNDGSKFIGIWYPRKYDGVNNKTTLSISKAGTDFLVNFNVHERVDENFYSADGSFKEVGHMEGNSIVINSYIKLSLINDNTILMNSKEYIKPSTNQQTNSVNTSAKKETYGTIKVEEQLHKVGEKFGGGIVFYVYNTGQHGLIAAINDQGSINSWDNGENYRLGATSATDGLHNTNIIMNKLGNRGYHAAKLCSEYHGGGFSDWYLPSKQELNLLYENRNIIGGLIGRFYWSSTETEDIRAWNQNFETGEPYNTQKRFNCNVRAIRTF